MNRYLFYERVFKETLRNYDIENMKFVNKKFDEPYRIYTKIHDKDYIVEYVYVDIKNDNNYKNNQYLKKDVENILNFIRYNKLKKLYGKQKNN